MDKGAFIISLDFELFWGLIDGVNYHENIKYVYDTREIIFNMIRIFEENKISVSWSTVGLLMLNDKEEFKRLESSIQEPGYENQRLNNYKNFKGVVGDSSYCDAVFFAADIIDQLKRSKYQTIGTHTFSHYYCLERGQTEEQFSNDLKLSFEAARRHGIGIESIVFPKNMYDEQSLNLIKTFGIKIYRGNSNGFLYHPSNHLFIRLVRLWDTYFNITGKYNHEPPASDQSLYNIKASRFLRPSNNTNPVLKKLKLKRIKDEMSQAAKKNHYYHLWWHPHNFSISPEENIQLLKEIIEHFKHLETKYGYRSESMESYVDKLKTT